MVFIHSQRGQHTELKMLKLVFVLLCGVALCEESLVTTSQKDLQDRLEYLEKHLATMQQDMEELSIVEAVAGSLGRFIGTRLLPKSDPECRWHNAKAICVPKCDCEFRYRPGDLTLSKMCRLRKTSSTPEIGDCDRNLDSEPGVLVKVAKGAKASAIATASFLDQAAPPTDPSCQWDWMRMKCSPGCYLDYRFGDFTIGRSCRRLPETTKTPYDPNNPPPPRKSSPHYEDRRQPHSTSNNNPPPRSRESTKSSPPPPPPPRYREEEYHEEDEDEDMMGAVGSDEDDIAQVNAFFDTNWGTDGAQQPNTDKLKKRTREYYDYNTRRRPGATSEHHKQRNNLFQQQQQQAAPPSEDHVGQFYATSH